MCTCTYICEVFICTPQDGLTPFLHFCASHGMQEQLELAINAGSDINVTDAVRIYLWAFKLG